MSEIMFIPFLLEHPLEQDPAAVALNPQSQQFPKTSEHVETPNIEGEGVELWQFLDDVNVQRWVQ